MKELKQNLNLRKKEFLENKISLSQLKEKSLFFIEA